MIGKTISHYKIISKLGEGGMGVVYKAQDTKLDREVAIKFLPRQIAASDEERERFKIEAKAAAALNHTNIATVYNIEDADDETFIVMEYIKGQELKDKIDAGPLPIDDTFNIAMQIAQGLQIAHESGVVHRDIKSSNIMLTDRGEVKIMDFGLAKLSGGSLVTKEGTTLGTAAYMSPEQAHGRPADQRSDIWSFGVVLYELLTGRLPFKGDYEHAIIYSIIHEQPDSISTLREDTPEFLGKVVDRSLAKEPDDRFQDFAAILNDLLDGDDSSPKRKRSLKPGGKRKVGRSLLWPAIALGTILVGVLGYFLVSANLGIKDKVPIAVSDIVNQTGEPQLDGLSEMLVTSLEQSRRLSVLPRASMHGMLSHLDIDSISTFDEHLVRQICARANIKTMATASIRKLGELYHIDLKILDIESEKYVATLNERAQGIENIPAMLDQLALRVRRDLQEKELEIAAASRPVAANLTPNMDAYHHYFLGMQSYYRANHGDAQAHFENAIAQDSTFGLAYVRLALLSGWGSANIDIDHTVRKGFEFIDRIPEKERYLLRAVASELNEGSFVDMLLTQVKILSEMEKRYPNDKDMLFLLGDAYFHSQNYQQGLRYFQKSVEIEPDNANALIHLVETYRDLGNYSEMRRVCERLIAVDHRAGYGFLISALALSGDIETGVDRLSKEWALEPQENRYPELMATLYVLASQYATAESILDSLTATTGWNAASGPGFRTRENLFLYTGQYRRAIAALDERLKRYGQNNWAWALQAGSLSKARMLNLGWGDRKAVQHQIDLARSHGFKRNHELVAGHILVGGPETDIKPDKVNVLDYLTDVSDEWINIRKIMAYIEEKDCAKAVALADEVLKTREYKHCFPFLYDLSSCYLELGRLESAIEVLQRLQLRWEYPMRAFYYPKGLYGLGKAFELQGDTQLAIQNYEKFLDLWKDADEDLPDLIDAKARLAKLKGRGE